MTDKKKILSVSTTELTLNGRQPWDSFDIEFNNIEYIHVSTREDTPYLRLRIVCDYGEEIINELYEEVDLILSDKLEVKGEE